MNRLRKLLLVFLLTLSSLALVSAAVAYYLINTPVGAQALVRYGLLHSAAYASVTVESFRGTIAQGLTLSHVEIRNWPLLGPRAVVRLQRVELRLPSLNRHRFSVNIFNGRVELPNCEALVFNGRYAEGKIDANAFSQGLDAVVVMQPFMPASMLKNLQGSVSHVDFSIKGNLSSPRLVGYFHVDRIKYSTVVVREGLAHFDLTVGQRGPDEWTLEGFVSLENGLVNVRRKTIDLEPSRVTFNGDPADMTLAIYGTTQANEYTIDFNILGTFRQPQLQVFSDPYLPQDLAMVALDMSNWIPTEFYSPVNNNVRQVGLKRKIIEDFNVGFDLKQQPTSRGVSEQTTYSKMLEGQYSLTDKFSLNVAEEIFPGRTESRDGATSGQSEGSSKPESLFYLKYKDLF